MLQRQAFATWSMREILLDWLVDVNMTMRLTAPSLWLTANLIDRALQKVVDVRRSRIQLVGVGALSLACKQEEIEIPCYRDLVYVTDRTYTKQELMDMEMIILEALHYEVIAPTAHHFLMRYCKLLHASETTRALALYYAERYVQSQGGALCKPSKLAAAALCAALAQRQAQHQPTCSHLTLEELRDCKKNIVVTGVLMRRMWESEDTSEAVRQAVVDAEAAMRDLLPKLAACVDIVSDLDDVQSSAGPSAILANAELWGIPLTLPEVLPSIRPVTTFLELLLATYEFSSLSEKGLIGNLLVNAREHAGVLSAGVTPAAVEIGVQALLRESPFAEGTLCTAEVRQCAAEIVAFVRGARPEAEAGNHQRCHASRRKYARQDPYLAVSALRLPDLVAGGFLPTLPKVGEVVAGGSELEKPAPVSEGSSDIGAQSDL